jgi:hypothetical protein
MLIFSTIVLAAAAAAFPPPATYHYTGSLGGERVGSWSVTVAQNPQGMEIDENSSASVFGMPLSATASLLLGPDFAPTKYNGTYRTPSQNPTVSVALTPNSATVVGAFSPQPRQIALDANTRHFVVIEPGLLAGLFALPAQLGAWKDSSVTWITPTTAQAESLSTNPAPSVTRPSEVASGDAVLSVERPIAVTIWYDPATLVPDEISVPSQNAVLILERP